MNIDFTITSFVSYKSQLPAKYEMPGFNFEPKERNQSI